MSLDAPLPHETATAAEVEMWGDEEEAAAWQAAMSGRSG